MNCTDKFLKHSERVGARFAEQNAGAFCPTAILSPSILLLTDRPRALYRNDVRCGEQVNEHLPSALLRQCHPPLDVTLGLCILLRSSPNVGDSAPQNILHRTPAAFAQNP